MTVTIRELSSLAEVGDIRAEWNALADEVAAGPTLVPSIVEAWWRHLGKGRLRVITARDGAGRLVGVAPLHERMLPHRPVVRWVGHGMGAVGELLLWPATAADVADAIWDHLAGDDRVVLQLIEYRHGGAGLDQLRRSDRWQVRADLRDSCPYIGIRGHAGAADLLAEPGRRKLRQNMARVDRAISADPAGLSVHVLTTPTDLDAVIGELSAVHDVAEQTRERLHFLRGALRDFTLDALRSTAAEGRLVLVLLRRGDRPVGFHVAVVTGNTAFAWLARFDPMAAELAPGHVMLRELVDLAAARRLDTVDLQLGDDPYKLRWSSGTYDTVGVLAAAPGRLATARVTTSAVAFARRQATRLHRH